MNENDRNAVDVERAWRDPEYLKTLTPEQLAALPPNPAGELKEDELAGVSGGIGGIGEILDLDATKPKDPDGCKTATMGVSGSKS